MARFGLCYGTYHAVDNPIVEAPEAARPLIEGSAVLIFPQSVGDTGNGDEGRKVGKPYVVVARRHITATGYDWYWDYYVQQQNYGQQIYIQAYGMRSQAWNIYTCKMKMPTYSNQARATAEPSVLQFECRFTDLVLVS